MVTNLYEVVLRSLVLNASAKELLGPTSSPAVAERPRDTSCLSVASIVYAYVERKFRFRFTDAQN